MNVRVASACDQDWASDDERLASLCAELDAIHDRVRAEIGDEDVEYIVGVDKLARRLELAGRVLIHVSLDPLSFGAGVLALAASHQLQVMEIGHTALHGAYDGLAGAEKFDSKRFRWVGEIDEESWRHAHNHLHHGFTNIAGRDSDLQVGLARWSPEVPYRLHHRLQIPSSLAYFLFWWAGMSLHSAGVLDIYARRREDQVIAPDKSLRTILDVHRKALRKIVPYKLENYVLYPALAGPLFFKVLLGNALADGLRDIYSAMTNYSNHIGEDVVHYPASHRVRSRAQWYRLQIESTNNFEVPRWMSVLSGGIDLHIEHHLFPKLPPNRLREIAPEVRAACERHGLRYRSDTWPRTLAKSFRMLARLGRPIENPCPPEPA
ncbi:Stearoyl-CoA 9-desaturase [Enhygromyxa salina]|uniref:Stearoyl-CoA 9-desaturase n=1 Tax=Enhygromyxa salina TaxID=215803 RepID=A0A2S9XKI2_9BACT|nr:fatty acid desaturase [Enhygromyxa salina]PRP93240.1 Stearoyl-CoA 9-desaturase [Enhygromyxa salina]